MRLVLAALLMSPACVEHESTPVCGDEALDESEACDDGNMVNGDGCTSSCAVEKRVSVSWSFVPVLGGASGPCPAETVELVGPKTSRSFRCDRMTGDLFVTSGSDVFARLRAANGDVVAESLPELPVAGRAQAVFYGNAGYLHVGWQLASCTRVTLLIGDTAQVFPCEPSHVYSAPIEAGTYDVTLGTLTKTGVIVGANNAITELEFVLP